MPLVKRVILPTHLSRCPKSWGITETGEEVAFQGDYDLTAVTNVTLCGALQQLGSILQAACQINEDLDEQLNELCQRSLSLSHRMRALEERVHAHNPKTVAVPESDLRSFSERKEHFEIGKNLSQMLFTVSSRPDDIRRLYEAAAETPVHLIREIDRFRTDGLRSSMYFTCKPVFGDSLKREKLKEILEIETRRPASFVALREWGSDDETLQSELELAPVSPAAHHRPPAVPHPPDLKLPLPEQRQLALSYKYPPQLVPIDVSGRGFRRMELFRQSLVQFDFIKNRKRRRRLRRRNTIADAREVRSALNNPLNLPSTSSGQGRSSTRSCSPSSRGGISSYTDRSFDTSSTKTSSEREVGLRSHHILGLEVSLPTPPRNVYTLSRHLTKEGNSFRADSMSQHDNDILNSVAHSSPREQKKKWVCKNHNVNCDDIVSEGEVTATKSGDLHSKKQSGPRLPISSSSGAINMAVKLREGNSRDEGTRSSSGNWSGSSSTRTSLESDIQQQHNHLQKATTSLTAATAVANTTREEDEEVLRASEGHAAQEENGRKEDSSDLDQRTSPSSSFDQESYFSESYPVPSTSPSSTPGGTASRTTDDFPSSSSHASDGTLTPTQDIQDIPFLDDDTSSAFSCDTEGYYTSFHLDSGLRPSVSYEGNKLASDSDAEVFGRGSTGTTNSSASLGTVIMRNPEKKTPPKPPQRVSSLERKENRESIITVIHVNGSTSSSREDVAGAEGAVPHDDRDSGSRSSSKEGDSGRETSSSLTDPMSPRQYKGGGCAHDAAESVFESDADSTERKENFRLKTAINTSGIPSMCVITPPQSDDESVRSGSYQTPREAPQGGHQVPIDGPQAGHQMSRDGPQGGPNKVTSESRVQRRVASFQSSNNNSKSVSFTPSCTTAVRQPGDGAVAPSVPSSSPSFTSHNTQQGYTPTLTVMSQHRSGELSAHLKVFPPLQPEPTPPPPKTQPEFLSLGRSVSERRAEIQLKVLGEKKPSSDVLLQRQGSRELSQAAGVTEASNLVSLKELPTTVGSTAHPFSAVPSNVKQSVVITPTNSLERRKANSKLGGAHVTLDSEGKVVYSSDSLPRQKSHTSFEPGPYIKPPPITTTNGSHTKVRIPGVSSIQSMPLPPVPGQQTTTTTSASVTRVSEKGLDPPLHSSITPQQPKLGTRSQVSAISQTLSGLSSHMQPRTISQINSIRSAQVKSPKTVLSDGLRSISGEEESAPNDQPKVEETTASAQTSYPTKFQLQQSTKEKPELQSQQSQEGAASSAQLLRKYPSLERQQEDSQLQLERLNNHRHVLQSQQSQELERQNDQMQSMQSCQQSCQYTIDTEGQVQQHLLQHSSQQLHQHTPQQLSQLTTQQSSQLSSQLTPQQISQLTSQQTSQHTLQQAQQKLQQQQEQHQQLLQQQLQLQQQKKQHILQQQHMELQKQLEQQQQQLHQHKAQQLRESQARQAEQQMLLQAKKDMQTQPATQKDNLVQTRQDLQRQQLVQLQQQQQQLAVAAAYQQQQQQPMYQLQEDAYILRQQQTQQQLLQQQLRLQNGSQVSGPTDVIMASQGAPMSPQSQRGAYIHVQSKAPPPAGQEQPALQLDSISYPGRPHSAQGYHVGTTSRAPTPIQGLSTSSSSPQRLPTNQPSLQHPSLRTHPGLMYGSQRSLQSLSLGSDGRGTPIPRPISTSPPPYDQYNVTNSDIYGRIGMTRQVQVGGTLPAGFGRNQRTYSSLPPNLRQPLTPSEVLAQQQQQKQPQQQGRVRHQYSGSKTLTRRASVAGTETSSVAKLVASNPSTPEKALEKKEKGSKREKDKDKEKKKKEAKTEKSPKKKWFWTLPLRRKKKNKEEQATEDDDGGFKDATVKTARKIVPVEDTSFIRYPSPDTGSSDLNSSYSSDVSSGEHGYRSSPSSEVYYYSQKAQLIQQQQQNLAMSVPSAIGNSPSLATGSNSSLALSSVPRSHPSTPVSPSDPQLMIPADGADLNDLSRNRRYMSRDEMYAAMRHPQYYNMNRNSIPGMSADFSQNSTPTSSRSSSPAVFGINPPPPYAIRPQVREGFQIPSLEKPLSSSSPPCTSDMPQGCYEFPKSSSDTEDSSIGSGIEPPAGYREVISTSPTDSQESDGSTSSGTNSNRIAKQTTLVDFKKMILEKSMSSAGGKERISAVEMLRASRPSIYGYSPPPAPVVVKPEEPVPGGKGEGIIMPPNSRNTARALLFQSRFGSGRRFRSPKTEIISTTIIEDKMEEEEEKKYEDEDTEDSDSEDISSSTTSSQERRSVQSVRGPLARAYSEPANQKPLSSNNSPPKETQNESQNGAATPKPEKSDSNSTKIAHSTPVKPHHTPPPAPDVSVILPHSADESGNNGQTKGTPGSPEKESIETAL